MKTLWQRVRPLICGGIIPWFGWVTMPCHWDGEPAFEDEDGPGATDPGYRADFLTVEWLWCGTTIMRGPAWPVEWGGDA